MKRTMVLIAILCTAAVALSVAVDGYALRAIAAAAVLTAGILAGLVVGIESASPADTSAVVAHVAEELRREVRALAELPAPYDERVHAVLQGIEVKIAELQRSVALILERVTR